MKRTTPLRATTCGIAARAVQKAPSRSVVRTRRHSAGSVFATVATRAATPEFATATSSPPRNSTAWATIVHRLSLPDVGLERTRAPPERPHLGHRRLGGLAVAAIVDRHVRTLARELDDDAAPDAPASAGHECGLALELAHRSTPNG